MKKILAMMAGLYVGIGFVNANCYEGYCRENKDMMFVAAEKVFLKEMQMGMHEYTPDENNQCGYHISSIAYAYATIESGLGDGSVAKKSNNWFSIRQGSGRFSYKRDKSWGKTDSNYIKYPDPFLSALDFMYLYKYGSKCGLGEKSVSYYKNGRMSKDAATIRYHKNLLATIKRFENKYFGKGQKLSDYKLEKVVQTIQPLPISKNMNKVIDPKIKRKVQIFKIFSKALDTDLANSKKCITNLYNNPKAFYSYISSPEVMSRVQFKQKDIAPSKEHEMLVADIYNSISYMTSLNYQEIAFVNIIKNFF